MFISKGNYYIWNIYNLKSIRVELLTLIYLQNAYCVFYTLLSAVVLPLQRWVDIDFALIWCLNKAYMFACLCNYNGKNIAIMIKLHCVWKLFFITWYPLLDFGVKLISSPYDGRNLTFCLSLIYEDLRFINFYLKQFYIYFCINANNS